MLSLRFASGDAFGLLVLENAWNGGKLEIEGCVQDYMEAPINDYSKLADEEIDQLLWVLLPYFVHKQEVPVLSRVGAGLFPG